MKICEGMSLNELAERMGVDADIDDARAMRRILVDRFGNGATTEGINEREWGACLREAIGNAKRQYVVILENFGDAKQVIVEAASVFAAMVIAESNNSGWYSVHAQKVTK